MKRFSKLIFIILTLVIMITAFTVVSIAALESPYTFTKTQSNANLNFDDWNLNEALKTTLNNDGVTTSFIAIRETYPGGNKYMYLDGMGGKGGGASWYSEITYSRSAYDVTEAPIMAVDFDVMTTNGRFGTTHNSATLTMRPYYYNGSGYKQFGSSTTGAAAPVALGQIGLNNEAYLWQHVTVIYEWVTGGTINTYVHINGAADPSYTATKDVSSSYASYADYIEETFFGVPYLSAAVWGQKSQIGLDNYKQTYFPAGYDRANVPTYIYNDSYTMPEAYKYTVATVTDTADNVTYFDDISKATAALADGYTLTLKEAPAEAIVINNAITLDTAGFEVTVESTAGYGITSTTDGVHTIEKLPSAPVRWDVCPNPENCTCLGAHKLAADTEVVVGEIPEYVGELPELEFNGLVLTLLGWSYENDGTVDELVAVTMNDAEAGVTLYPVFSQKEYDFRLDSKGVISYYTADQYVQLFADAQNDDNIERTITLLRDVEVYDLITFTKGWSAGYVKLVLDLRGNTLTRVNLTGNKYKYNGTEYVADGTLSQVSNGANAFYCNKPNNTFTITSSEGKGNFVTYAVNGDIYYDADGKMERYEATTVSGSNFVYFYNNANRHVTLNNINIYAANIFDASGGSNTDCTFTMDNCSYYATVGADSSTVDYTLYFESITKFTANISNSLFYYPEGLSGTPYFFRLADKSSTSDYTVIVDNCDIIGISNIIFFNFYSATPKIMQPDIQVNNTRLYNATCNVYYKTYLGEGTLYSERGFATTTVKPGYVSAPGNTSVPYTVPANKAVTIDSETKQPIFANDTTDISVTFAYEVKKCSEVPASLTDVRLSMLYYTNFNMALYVPVKENTAVTSITGFTSTGTTVKIDGNEYHVFVKESTTTSVSDTVIAELSYTVSGAKHKQTFNVSALVYADLILNYPETEEETTAVANMVRYIKEARLASSLTAGEEFDNLIALGNLAELGAKEDYADASVDYSNLSGYVQSIKFMLDGTNAAYVITMTDSAVTAGATVSVSYVGGAEITLNDSTVTANAKYTSGTRVYDIAANAIEITVTVPAAEEGAQPTVITGTYSVKAYINATDNALAKAMYEFGVAAKAYREYLIENT